VTGDGVERERRRKHKVQSTEHNGGVAVRILWAYAEGASERERDEAVAEQRPPPVG
jgi:hypothetical protein